MPITPETALAPDGTHRPARDGSLPGDLAVWIFIVAELLVFAVFFISYAIARGQDVVLFDAMQRTLDRNAGAANTLLLVTSSWCVARAVAATQQNLTTVAARWLLGGLACGAGFLVIKALEYAAKFSAGVSLSSNNFYMFYLSLTFFHFLHVILGMVVLAVLWQGIRKRRYHPGNLSGLESGAAYWHMVDLVWLVLFPLIYVMH
ncbi:MAG: cytochrome c oxidase subunit 3 family protein [Rhodocyclaceae bacterium]|nr:cytochrome c oxidase subunit 3 family protein [Rhodocyclaceae bacterium]